MASAPQSQALPLFYNELIPINRDLHGSWRTRHTDKAKWLVDRHAVPLTVEEFPAAQRHFPIVFSSGDETVPLALMGMNEGVNVFIDDEGAVTSPVYIPAYARRYPFMLAKLRQDADDLSLCFDPTSELVGEFDEGSPLFEEGEPSESCKATLRFCEQFEVAGNKTQLFIAELQKNDLLIDGELNVQLDSMTTPLIYRGFRMVDENKLKDLRGDLLRSWNKNGMLPLIFAHLFSLELAREILGRQFELGKGPQPAPQQ